MQRGKRGDGNRQNKPFGDSDIIVKRLTIPGSVISSSAGGVIVVTILAQASQVQSLPASEWASFAARYQQFRVRSVRVIAEPVFPGSGTPIAAATTGHSTLYVSDFIGSSNPGTAAQVLSDEGAVILSTSKRVDFMTTWARNPNAKLWNPTGAALPVANGFSIVAATNSTAALVASASYYTTSLVWEVEFRGSQ